MDKPVDIKPKDNTLGVYGGGKVTNSKGIGNQFRGPENKKAMLVINIKNQELLYKKTELEVALFRLKVCGEQAKLGVQFTGKFATICEGIAVTVPPGQVIPCLLYTSDAADEG